MVCTRPITGYRTPSGGITFAKWQGYVDKPVTIPCGQCMQCRLEKSRQWAMRIVHESQMHEENSFITLTYADDKLPVGQTLVKHHHQDFMKRLRKQYSARRIRYYHVGEYGETTSRPHYHTILFGLDFADKVFHGRNALGMPLYISRQLDEIWGHGLCVIGEVTFESAAYCGRYVMKKLSGNRKAEYEGRLPEYSTSSREPRIGGSWFAAYGKQVINSDFCVVNGHKVRVPKAYDEIRSKSEYPLGRYVKDAQGDPVWVPPVDFFSPLERTKNARLAAAAKRKDNQTPERLAVIEELTELRVERLKRNVK